MHFDAATIFQLVLLLTWRCLSQTPAHRKTHNFKAAYLSMAVLQLAMLSVTLCFAPGLFEILNSVTPPGLPFFKSLPTIGTKRWGIYLLVLEHPTERFRIYIGSALHGVEGVVQRFRNYRNHAVLPLYVEEALEDGFTITHMGLLCSIPIPNASLWFAMRTLMKALEAAFTYAFGALAPDGPDEGLTHLAFWPLESLSYDGLCSHSPLIEGVIAGKEDRSPEELDALAAQKAERLRLGLRQYKHDWYMRKRQDPAYLEASRQKRRESSASAYARDPDRIKGIAVKNFAKAKEAGTYPCSVCNMFLGKKSGLEAHKKTKDHLDKAAGVYKGPSAASKATCKTHAKAKASKAHFCGVCQRACASASALATHNMSGAHIRKATANTGGIGPSGLSEPSPGSPSSPSTLSFLGV